MELLAAALETAGYGQHVYGFQPQHPLLWGQQISRASPAPSEDCDSVLSDATDLTVPFFSRPSHRTRKQPCPARAPMYSNTGAVRDIDSQPQHYTERISKPVRQPKPQVTSSSTVVAGSRGKVLHGAAAAAKQGKKTNPCSGPCDNCGATSSPQWRHGSKTKPVVCNACGIRFLRTGSFDKAVDKKRCGTPSGGPTGARQPKRNKAEGATTSMEDKYEDNDQQATSQAGPAHSHDGQSCADSKAELATSSRRTSATSAHRAWGAHMQAAAAAAANDGGLESLNQAQELQQYASPGVSPAESPANSGIAYNNNNNALSSLPPPLCLGAPALNAGSTNRTITSASNNSVSRTGQQQQQQQRGCRVIGAANGFGVSRHGPSPLSLASNGQVVSKPSRFGAPATAGAANNSTVPGSANLSMPSTSYPSAAGKAAAPAAAKDAASAGATPAQISPELIKMVQQLASVLGSVDKAIDYIKSLSNKSSAAAAAAGAGCASFKALTMPSKQ